MIAFAFRSHGQESVGFAGVCLPACFRRIMPMSNVAKRSAAIAPESRRLHFLGALILLVAIAASFILALDHFALVTPPGCGPQSGCDRATRSAWGTIPGLDWPTSLAGVAYFSALLVTWLASSRSVSGLFRLIVWLGVIGSAVFIIVMFKHGFVCKYCLATHLANFAFLVVMEFSIRPTEPAPNRAANRAPVRSPSHAPSRIALPLGVTTFLVVTGVLAVVHVRTNAKRIERNEAARIASMQGMTNRTSTAPASTGVISTTTEPAVIENTIPFTGRYRLGPENAPIRIVMFMDYQCTDCKAIESQAMALLQRRKDVSLSVKQFPMSNMCNPNINVNMHPNACWAARAAEAAGMLRGNDGFWQMHNWLFERGGSFTDANLPPALQQMGYDPQQFIQTMSGNNTNRLVQEDIAEGAALGLMYTPMIFINGVELRGFIGNPGALTRTVEELAATNPPSASPTQDQPPKAAQKYVDDWAKQAPRQFIARARNWAVGPADAKVQIMVWLDYQEPFTAELDRHIKQAIADGRSIRYEVRQYPLDQSCNAGLPQTFRPFGCMAARAAEAAGALGGAGGEAGGNDAYWKMHDWLLAHQVPLNDDLLREGAKAAGVDPAALLAKMNEPEIAAIVSTDAANGRSFIMQGVPSVYVNNRWVPRWKLEGEDIFGRIVDAAERGQ